MTSTIGYKISKMLGQDEIKKDTVFLDTARETVAKLIVAEVKGKKEVKLAMKHEEKLQLKGLEDEFKKLAGNEEVCEAYFPLMPLYCDRIVALNDNVRHAALMDDGAKIVIDDLKREIARMNFLRPMKMGESSESRAREVVKKVLAAHGLSNERDPETVLAIELWSKIDVEHPAVKELVSTMLEDVDRILNDARARERFLLKRYAFNCIRDREGANVQQAAESARRENMNPGMRKGGFWERIGESIAHGFASKGEAPPSRHGKRKTKTALRELVDEATA